MSELQGRVEDWKGHKVDHFGELLLYGSFTVLKGEGAREVEREVSAIFYLWCPWMKSDCLSDLQRSDIEPLFTRVWSYLRKTPRCFTKAAVPNEKNSQALLAIRALSFHTSRKGVCFFIY